MEGMELLFIKITKDCDKKELADNFIELANNYISEKNYSKAKKFLFQAKQLYPSKKIDEILEKIVYFSKNSNRRRKKSSFVEGSSEFDDYLDGIEKDIDEGRYAFAEECLSKAKILNNKKYRIEMHNKHRIQMLSTKLSLFKKISQNSNLEQKSNETDKNIKESLKCVNMAKYYMTEKNYAKAEQLLLKAQIFYATKEIEILLDTLCNIFSKTQKEKYTNISNKVKADRFVELADECIRKKDYENAKKFLFKAKKIISTSIIDNKLAELEKLSQKKKEYHNRFCNNPDKDEAERCVERAQFYISIKNYNDAKILLLEAKRLYPTAKINSLLNDLSKLYNYQKTKPKYFFNKNINKDEAERCVEIADRYLFEKKYEEAQKYLLKAKKLFPLDIINKKLEILNSILKDNLHKNDKTFQNKKNDSKEHIDIVNKILNCKHNDYCNMLGVDKNATSEMIRKAFKQLALKVHPDKNDAPGAEEAFKRIRKAYEALLSSYKTSNENSYHKKNSSHKTSSEDSFYKTKNENFFHKTENEHFSYKTSNESSSHKTENEYFFHKPSNDNFYRTSNGNSSFNHEYRNSFFYNSTKKRNSVPKCDTKIFRMICIIGVIIIVTFIFRFIYDVLVCHNFTKLNYLMNSISMIIFYILYFVYILLLFMYHVFNKLLPFVCNFFKIISLFLYYGLKILLFFLYYLIIIYIYILYIYIIWKQFLYLALIYIFALAKSFFNFGLIFLSHYSKILYNLIHFHVTSLISSPNTVEYTRYGFAFIDFFNLNIRNMFTSFNNIVIQIIGTYVPSINGCENLNQAVNFFFNLNVYLWHKIIRFSMTRIP